MLKRLALSSLLLSLLLSLPALADDVSTETEVSEVGTSKTVDLAEFAKIVRFLPERLTAKIVVGNRKAAAKLMGYVVEEISTNDPYPVVDRGAMRNSVSLDLTPTGASVSVDAPYASIQEGGSRPFTPPLAPLISWAERKGHPQPEAFARAVQRSIAKNGIVPKHYFARAMARWKQEGVLPKEIGYALGDAAVGKLFGG